MDAAYDSGDALTILGFVSLAHFHPSPFIIFMLLLWQSNLDTVLALLPL
jgi:hypothetical protein